MAVALIFGLTRQKNVFSDCLKQLYDKSGVSSPLTNCSRVEVQLHWRHKHGVSQKKCLCNNETNWMFRCWICSILTPTLKTTMENRPP